MKDINPDIIPAKKVAQAAPTAPHFSIKGMFNITLIIIQHIVRIDTMLVFFLNISWGCLPKNIEA